MKLNADTNLAEFPPLCLFFFLCLLFSIDFPRFYRRSLRVPRIFLTLRNTQAIKGHHGSQQSTWANVRRSVLSSGLGCGETVALSWDCALSLNDKFLVGRHVPHGEYTTRNLLTSSSRGDSSPTRNRDMSNWCLFNTQTGAFLLPKHQSPGF